MINTITALAKKALKADKIRAMHDSQWYANSGAWCALLDADYSLTPGTTAGYIAALSPMNSWESQLLYTPPSIAACLALIKAGHAPHSGIRGSGFFSNRDKACRILMGEKPLEVLGGDKVTRFFRNLTGDFDCVTIDRHALAIAGWKKSLTSNAYSRIEFAFRMAGKRLEMTGAEVQAMTWCYWRRNHSAHSKHNQAKGF